MLYISGNPAIIMKQYFCLLLLLIPLAILADDIKEYKASNGVTYHVGDTLRLGHGTNNGNFTTLKVNGFTAFMIKSHSHDGDRDSRLYASNTVTNARALVKSIKQVTQYGETKYYLVVTIQRAPGSYDLDIEAAINNCEVANCTGSKPGLAQAAPDKYDQIKKLKQLLDSGALTQSEYDEQKKKLLNQ